MKKFGVALLIILTICTLTACNPDSSKNNLKENVSYYETHLYTGDTASFAITIIRGKKEVVSIADGAVGNLIDLASIKVTPLNTNLYNKEYCYKLTGAGGVLTGELTKDMFGSSYSAAIANIDTIGELASVNITSSNVNDNLELTNRMKDMLTWDEILTIGGAEFKDKITEEVDAETFDREIHIKFINNRADRTSPYYWYISFIKSKSDFWALLLDPETGEIISKKA